MKKKRFRKTPPPASLVPLPFRGRLIQQTCTRAAAVCCFFCTRVDVGIDPSTSRRQGAPPGPPPPAPPPSSLLTKQKCDYANFFWIFCRNSHNGAVRGCVPRDSRRHAHARKAPEIPCRSGFSESFPWRFSPLSAPVPSGQFFSAPLHCSGNAAARVPALGE